MKPRLLPLLAVMFAVCIGSLFQTAHAGSKRTDAIRARIHFSCNFEGELEPCG